MLERVEEYRYMAENEREHWWYQTLHKITFDAIHAQFSHKDISILDAGCGTGGLLVFLRQHGYSLLRGFDLSETAVKCSLGHGFDVSQMDIADFAGHFQGEHFDVIVSNDTLYYLNDTSRRYFFENCYTLLNPGGLVITNLPELNSFAGIHDLAVGIKNRFTQSDLSRMIDSVQFEVLNMAFWPFLLSPLILSVRVFQRIKLKVDPLTEIRSDVKMPPSLINRFFLTVCRLESLVFSRKPFGSSLFFVVRRR